METAIHNAQPVQVFQQLKKVAEEEKVETENQSRIIELEGDERFELLKEQINLYIEGLRNSLADITRDSTVEEIGFRYLAVETTIAYLKTVRDLPASLKEVEEVCRKQKKTNNQKSEQSST